MSKIFALLHHFFKWTLVKTVTIVSLKEFFFSKSSKLVFNSDTQ